VAYGSDDWLKLQSAQTLEEFRQEAIWLNLTSQTDTEGWASGSAHSVQFNRPDWAKNDTPSPKEGVAASNRARGGNWATARRGAADVLTFSRTAGFSEANEILWEDAMEIPWPVVEQTRRRQVYVMRKAIDEGLYANILAGIASADTTRIGTATSVFLPRAAPYTPTGDVGELIFQIIEDYSLKLEMMDVNSPSSDGVGGKYIVMSPACFRALLKFMREEKYSWDPLTADILRENRIFAERGYRGRLSDLDIISWSGIPIPAAGTTAGTNDWPIICGIRGAWRANVRPTLTQVFTPETNQISDAPAHLMRQAGDYAALEIHGGLMHRYNLRTQ